MPLLRDAADDLSDWLDEAEVQHLIDFVEHQEFDRAEIGRAGVQVIEQSAGRRNQDVQPLGERTNLRAMRHAAEDHGDLERQPRREIAETLRDLAGEFARRAEHERACSELRRRAGIGEELVEDRQREGGRLAGAGLRDADEIAALHQSGNRLRLDWRRLMETHFDERFDEGLGEAEAIEIFQCM